jgi:hypothetical protein
MEETGSTASGQNIELSMKESQKIFALIPAGIADSGNVQALTLASLPCLSVASMEKSLAAAADGKGPSLVDFVAIEPHLHPDIRRDKSRREMERERRDVGPICLI